MIRNLYKLNKLFFSSVVFFCIAVLFCACNKKDIQPATQPPPVRSPVVAPVQKVLTSAVRLPPSPAGNQFDFSNKKDPFKPFVVAKVPSTSSDMKKAIREGLPIHSFDVSQFRLIGLVTSGKENQAMVVDPNGKGYVLRVGMLIGKNDGRIVTINSAGVDVVEQFKDDNGRVHKENIRITLPRKQ